MKVKLFLALFFVITTLSGQIKRTQSERQEILDAKKSGKAKIFDKDSPCSNVIIQNKELEGEVIYSTQMSLNNPLYFIRTKKPEKNKDTKLIFFYLNTNNCSHYEKGLYLKLSNGEILRFEDAEVECSYSSGSYMLFGTLVLTDELYSKFSQNSIIQFSLSGKNLPKEKRAEENRKVLECIFDPMK